MIIEYCHYYSKGLYNFYYFFFLFKIEDIEKVFVDTVGKIDHPEIISLAPNSISTNKINEKFSNHVSLPITKERKSKARRSQISSPLYNVFQGRPRL